MQLKNIHQRIYEIRGQKVMFDFDLAELYEVETRVLNQAVKRNMNRFPERFMFRLTKLMGIDVITNCDDIPHKKTKNSFAFGFYGTWSNHAGKCFTQRNSNTIEYCNCGSIYLTKRICLELQRDCS